MNLIFYSHNLDLQWKLSGILLCIIHSNDTNQASWSSPSNRHWLQARQEIQARHYCGYCTGCRRVQKQPVGSLLTPPCCCLIAKSCSTLCNAMDYSTQGFPVLHCLPEMLKLMSTESVMLSNHLVLCLPLLLTSVFPASGSFPMSKLYASGGLSTGASASASALPMNIQGWSPLELTGLISLQSKELSRDFSSTTVWKHHIFGTQPSLWSNSHISTWLLSLLVFLIWGEERGVSKSSGRRGGLRSLLTPLRCWVQGGKHCTLLLLLHSVFLPGSSAMAARFFLNIYIYIYLGPESDPSVCVHSYF